jgi:hypothetical protein
LLKLQSVDFIKITAEYCDSTNFAMVPNIYIKIIMSGKDFEAADNVFFLLKMKLICLRFESDSMITCVGAASSTMATQKMSAR